jgi:hypothetical protein
MLAVEPERHLRVGQALPISVDVGEDIGPFHVAIIAPTLAWSPTVPLATFPLLWRGFGPARRRRRCGHLRQG